jgi:hypothetical protein
MASGKVQQLAREKLFQLQTEIAQREDEVKRLNTNLKMHEDALTQLEVVNHID